MKFPIESCFDWKESPEFVIEEIAPILLSLGVYTYVNPAYSYGDEQAFIFTKKKFTRKSLFKYLKAHYDYHSETIDDWIDIVYPHGIIEPLA